MNDVRFPVLLNLGLISRADGVMQQPENRSKFRVLSATFFAILVSLAIPQQSGAQTSTYNKSTAVAYAINNYNAHNKNVAPYAPYGTVNLFYDFQLDGQNNCAHFANQCILAGLCGTSDRKAVYNARFAFIADKNSPMSWYYNTKSESSPPWRGASAMYNYARGNWPTYKGLHFDFVTEDKVSAYDITKIQIGDIVFSELEGSGVTHVMVVSYIETRIQKTDRKYEDRVQLTYQTNDVLNRGIANIRAEKPKLRIHVYRPVNYTTKGL